jgi:hypothetical protein
MGHIRLGTCHNQSSGAQLLICWRATADLAAIAEAAAHASEADLQTCYHPIHSSSL